MKKSTTVILLLLICISGFSQRKSKLLARDALFEFSKQTDIKLKVPNDTLSYRLNYTNYCLYKFQRENMVAFGATFVGGGLIFYSGTNSLNGIDAANDYWYYEFITAGSSEKQPAIQRKWDNEIKRINNRNEIIAYIGGAVILGGGVLHLLSYRWLKRAYIVPIENGIAVKINF